MRTLLMTRAGPKFCAAAARTSRTIRLKMVKALGRNRNTSSSLEACMKHITAGSRHQGARGQRSASETNCGPGKDPRFSARFDYWPLPLSFRQKLVVIDDSGHRHFAFGSAVFDPHHAPFALHADALGQSDFRREGERKSDGRAFLNYRIQVEADTACAHVPQARSLARNAVIIDISTDADRNAQCEPSGTPFFLLGLNHASSKVAKWQR